MPWLLRSLDGDEARVLATLTVAHTRRERSRGLLGRTGFEGALLLERTRSVHTVGMRFAIDVAWCAGRPDDGPLTVVRVATVRPNRLTRPVLTARHVVEAEAGAFARWGVGVGDRIEVRG